MCATCSRFAPPSFSHQCAMAGVPAAQLSKEQQDELLCTYAALILHDDGADITSDGMNNLIKASGCSVEAYWPVLFAKMIKTQGMDALVAMGGGGGGGGGGGAVAAAGGGAAAAGGAADAKKEEVVEEEEDDGVDFDLYG